MVSKCQLSVLLPEGSHYSCASHNKKKKTVWRAKFNFMHFCNKSNLATLQQHTCSVNESPSSDGNFYCCTGIINNLIGPYQFWGITPRNSTWFTRSFLIGRHTWSGHVTRMGTFHIVWSLCRMDSEKLQSIVEELPCKVS